MPPICDLHGVRGSLARAIGIGPGPVTGDNLDTRVLAQPSRQGLGLPIRQQVDHPVALQVDQDGAVAVTTAPRPVINRQHTRGGLPTNDQVEFEGR
jgi:hypothetical protein